MGGEDEGAWVDIDGSVSWNDTTLLAMDAIFPIIIPCTEWQRVWE